MNASRNKQAIAAFICRWATKGYDHALRAACLVTLAACAQHVEMVDERSSAPLPVASYESAAMSGSGVYRILPEESFVLVHVTREGAMKNLGHDHAVASEDLQGYIEISDDPAASRADVVLPLRNLIVDKPEYRDRLGLDTNPSESDVAGTYTNMLKVLGPEFHPWVEIHARIVSVDETTASLGVSITMNERAAEFVVPVELKSEAGQLVVSGQTTLNQSDFGLIPFQAAGGLLRVADELEITFHLVGAPIVTP